MTGTTFADRVGLATRVLELYRADKADLAKNGIRPEYWIKALSASLDELLHEEARQETLKGELKRSTQNVRKLDGRTYHITAGAIDAAIGAYGRGTPKGKSVSRLRSQLHRRKTKKPPPEPEPPEAAPP